MKKLLLRFRALRKWFGHLPNIAAAEYIVSERAALAASIDVQLLDDLRDHVRGLTTSIEQFRSFPSEQKRLFDERDDAEALWRLGTSALRGDVPLLDEHLDELLLDWSDDESDALVDAPCCALRSDDANDPGSGPGVPTLHAERARTRLHAEAAGIWTESDPRIVSALLEKEIDGGLWLVFPYSRPGRPRPEFFRAKQTRRRNGSRSATLGYSQPEGVTGVYFPPLTRASADLNDPSLPLILAEGEKKALCLDRLGYLTVGIPGTWCAGGGRHDPTKRLHRWLREDVFLKGRVVVIAFDSDILTNPHVRDAAEWTLRLLAAEGAVVRTVDWTALRPEISLAAKCGIDDLARLRGASAVHELIRSAVATLAPTSIRIPMSIASAGLGPAQKIIYGALSARAKDLHVNGVTHAALARTTRRSRRAVGQAIDALVAAKAVARTRGIATRTRMVGLDEDDEWWREPDTYVLHHDQRATFAEVDLADLGDGPKTKDTEALVLGILRQHPNGLDRRDLMLRAGMSPSTLARTLKCLRDRITIAAGCVTAK